MKKKQLEDKIRNIDRVSSYSPQYNDEPTFSEKVEQLIKEHLRIELNCGKDYDSYGCNGIDITVKLFWDKEEISHSGGSISLKLD